MANLCVRASGDVSFNGDGSTWAAAASNGAVGALRGLPASLVRGNSYYVADGTYPTWSIATTTSTTVLASVIKATIGAHGTATGWSDTFGDGVATIATRLTCSTTYLLVDGVVGSGVGSVVPYGFQVQSVEGGVAVVLASNCTVRYTEAYCITNLGDYAYPLNQSCTVFQVAGTTNATIDHCYGHGADNLINTQVGGQGAGWNTFNVTITNSVFQASRSLNGNLHSNVIYLTGVDGMIWANNLAFNYNDEGLFPTWWEAPPKNITIYNSIFWGGGGPSATSNPRGIEIRQFDSSGAGHTYVNIIVYGCTFIDLGNGSFLNRASDSGFGNSTGCAFVNNLQYASTATVGDTATVATNTVQGTTSIFVDYAGGDFHLTAHTANGTTLSSPYNTDKDGNARPAGGVWDRGAYEFGVATPFRLGFRITQV